MKAHRETNATRFSLPRLALLGLVVLGACMADTEMAQRSEPAAAAVESEGASRGAPASASPRMIIRTADC